MATLEVFAGSYDTAATQQIRRVCVYVLDEDPEPRLIELRKLAADRGWTVVAEYVECMRADYYWNDRLTLRITDEMRAFHAAKEADHALA